MRTCLSLVLLLACPTMASAQAGSPESGQEVPSEAMLEFLGELAPVDEETWRLLEHHALKDVPHNKEVSSE